MDVMDQMDKMDLAIRKFRPWQRRRGMTLIEILVAVAISSILAGAAYSVYAGAATGWQVAQRRTDMFQRGRGAMDLIARCLRSAEIADAEANRVFEGFDQIVEGPVDELGTAGEVAQDAITFRTNAPIHLFGDKEIADQAEIEFYLEPIYDEVTGEQISSRLMMRVDDTYDADATTGGWLVEVAENINALSFGYFNGTEWVETWTSSDGIPRAVEAGFIVFDPKGKESPMHFSRVLRLEAWHDASQSQSVPTDSSFSFGEARGTGTEQQGGAGVNTEGGNDQGGGRGQGGGSGRGGGQ